MSTSLETTWFRCDLQEYISCNTLCKTGDCPCKSTKLLALPFDHKFIVLPRFRSLCHLDFVTLTVASCKCLTVAQVLLYFGFFPTAPSQPRMAVSVDLLAFYQALFERSCDAVNALASTLHMHYIRRGFRMVNKNVRACLSLIVMHSTQRKEKKQGMAIQEPFRWSLGSAVQWYDILQVEVDQRIKATLQVCRDHIRNAKVQALPVTPTSTPCTPVWHLQSMTPHHPSLTISLHNPSPTPASSSDVFASCKQSLSLGSCGLILVQ